VKVPLNAGEPETRLSPSNDRSIRVRRRSARPAVKRY
jgi:hypothetical protein